MKRSDLTQFVGKQYHDLTFLGEHYHDGVKRKIEVLCKCGTKSVVFWDNLRYAKTKSCGCKQSVKLYGRQHKLYKVWTAIRQRCNNPKDKAYRFYGGRGVKICDEWDNNYEIFFDWCLANGWAEGLQLDKDTKGNGMLYSPENCVFISQLDNLRSTRWVKLSVEKVKEIRSSKLKNCELALIYKVYPSTIVGIKKGIRWKNI